MSLYSVGSRVAVGGVGAAQTCMKLFSVEMITNCTRKTGSLFVDFLILRCGGELAFLVRWCCHMATASVYHRFCDRCNRTIQHLESSDTEIHCRELLIPFGCDDTIPQFHIVQL